MPIVYAVCEPTHKVDGVDVKLINMAPAREYGDLVILLPTQHTLLAPVPTVRALREKLKNFTDEDYILLVGDPVLMATVAMVASDLNKGRVNYLKWDRRLRRYYSITVDAYGREV